jgi:hypothetical protein
MIQNQIFKFCEHAAPAGNPNPFGCGGQKKQGFLAGAWGHIEYLNILIFKSFD